MNTIYFLKRLLLFYFIICLSFYSLNGQRFEEVMPAWQSTLTKAISQKGYQNVILVQNGTHLTIGYENRVQRFEPKAIVEIIKILKGNAIDKEIITLELIPQRLQLPLVNISFSIKDFQYWKDGRLALIAFINSMQIVQSKKHNRNFNGANFTNSGNYRLELELEPRINLGLGGFPDPVLHRFSLVPSFNTFLWKGAQLKLKFSIPISSEFQIIDEDFTKPNILSFSQSFHLSNNFWIKGTIGYFTQNRYGGEIAFTKFFQNSNFAIRGKAGYTGYASYPIKLGLEEAIRGWEYADINYLDYEIGGVYWFKQWNTQLQLSYAKTLFQKNRLKFTVLQRFNEVDIGFFAFRTQRGNNYGFQTNIPLFPKKYWKPKRLSIRPSRTIDYTYHATQFFADSYKVDDTILDFYRQYHPGFIRNQLVRSELWE